MAARTPHNNNRRPRIILGITGSIAAVKGPRLALRLANELKADVKVVLTRTVEQYFWKEGRAVATYDRESWMDFERAVASSSSSSFTIASRIDDENANEQSDWRSTSGSISIHYAEEEWNDYKSLNDSVLHIELRSWADICVVAPLSAHTLSKIANGLCDDLLTCILRAWDFGNDKPVVLAPAMNTAMWEHPLTTMQLNTIKNFHNNDVVEVVQPVAKTLACGEVGVGALADLNDIVTTVDQCLQHSFSNDNEMKSSLSERKDSMRRALLKLAKDRFHEMQSTHQKDPQSQLAAPISPTPHAIIENFLPYLRLNSSKLLVDLGCGDGRWLVAATKLSQCRSFGIDIDDERLKLATQSIAANSLSSRIHVQRRDIFDFVRNDTDTFCRADVFILYLFRDAMAEVGKLLQDRLRQRQKQVYILTVGFTLKDWVPTQEQVINGLRVYFYSRNMKN